MKNHSDNHSVLQKYPFARRMNLELKSFNKLNHVQPKRFSVNNQNLSTNVTFSEPEQVDKLISNPIEEERNKPQVSSGGLKPPPKDPDQSIQLDMFKDEWNLEELLSLNVTEIPFLLDKLIPKESLVVLAGQSEIGKSTLYTQLALSIIRADDEFLSCKLNTSFKRVLIVSTEDGPIPLSFRANKQIAEFKIEVETYKNCNIIFNFDQLQMRVKKYLDQNPVDLIIIDAFGDVFQGDINASNSVRNFLNTYVAFIQKYKCSVLFVHHICKGNKKQKSEKDQLLGSTGIEGKMRNVLMLSAIGDKHQLSIAKGNYVSREDKKTPLYLKLDANTLTFSRTEAPVELPEADFDTSSTGSRAKCKPGKKRDENLFDRVISLYKEGKSQVEIAALVGRDKSTICKYIKEYNASQGPQYDTSLVGDVE